MIRKFAPCLAGIVLALGMLLVGNTGLADEKGQQAEKLMDLMGLNDIADSLPAQMQGQMARYKQKLPPDAFAVFERVMQESFAPKTFKQIVKAAVLEGYDAERMSNALKWFATPLALQLRRLEKKGNTPEGKQGLQAYVAGFKTKPPAQERVQLIVRMVRSEEAADMVIELVLAMTKTMMVGVSGLMPETQRIKPEVLNSTLARVRKQITGPLANQIVIRYLYNFQEVPPEDLNKSSAFFESTDGKWVKTVLFKGLFGAFRQMSGEMISKLGVEYQKFKDQ